MPDLGDVTGRRRVVFVVAVALIIAGVVTLLVARSERGNSTATKRTWPSGPLCAGVSAPRPSSAAGPAEVTPTTTPPPGDTPPATVALHDSQRVEREVDQIAGSMAFSDNFAGFTSNGDGSFLIRTKNGQLPDQLRPLAAAGVVFDVRPARYTAADRACLTERWQASSDPVCEAVVHRLQGIGYEPTNDQITMRLKPRVPVTTSDQLAAALGVDPTAITIVRYDMKMEPSAYPPFCPPCRSDDSDRATTPTTSSPDGVDRAPTTTEPCSTRSATDEPMPTWAWIPPWESGSTTTMTVTGS